ncbi:hypothetical protein GCM10022232_23990 [Streptomyces plumbiresistens]|uniref:Uncharacterized protein n=1 Tax=Streptomyces plumbiresistens TaxID=511811 RepID=A0ABP7QZ36_9ACTN
MAGTATETTADVETPVARALVAAEPATEAAMISSAPGATCVAIAPKPLTGKVAVMGLATAKGPVRAPVVVMGRVAVTGPVVVTVTATTVPVAGRGMTVPVPTAGTGTRTATVMGRQRPSPSICARSSRPS